MWVIVMLLGVVSDDNRPGDVSGCEVGGEKGVVVDR